ncbi:hypothetical protein Tsubulata_007017 [Turnera subulata]|uniref:Uncharacterized protein n=1 Tax=Turnera subulata TaxID=218843 RepID=A0A9Q0FF25_9ROSI|nr:hypothetical protein Tsubulata_007017 [Turnera subulata]
MIRLFGPISTCKRQDVVSKLEAEVCGSKLIHSLTHETTEKSNLDVLHVKRKRSVEGMETFLKSGDINTRH